MAELNAPVDSLPALEVADENQNPVLTNPVYSSDEKVVNDEFLSGSSSRDQSEQGIPIYSSNSSKICCNDLTMDAYEEQFHLPEMEFFGP